MIKNEGINSNNKKVIQRSCSPIKKENSFNSSLNKKNVKKSANSKNSRTNSSYKKKVKKEFFQFDKQINDEIDNLLNEIQLIENYNEIELKFRAYLAKYDITKDINYSLICLSSELNDKANYILNNEKIWNIHINILVVEYGVSFKQIFILLNKIFLLHKFLSIQIKSIYDNIISLCQKVSVSADEVFSNNEIIPKEFLAIKENKNEKKINKGINRSLTPKIKKTKDYLARFDLETDLLNAKLINEDDTIINYAVFELDKNIQNKTGHKYIVTPLKEKVNRNEVVTEIDSLNKKYKDFLYQPFTKEIVSTVKKENNRLTFGKIEF